MRPPKTPPLKGPPPPTPPPPPPIWPPPPPPKPPPPCPAARAAVVTAVPSAKAAMRVGARGPAELRLRCRRSCMVFAFLALGGFSEANDDTPNKNRFGLHSVLKGIQQWMACST